ncbi:hypothetical protein H0E87_003477 [Populus deltoides]|uniref:Uncharacterized protein n=1 Tax=Populus deltoides TaxID=3696 RepID=A0A8T2ZZ33_POPDE|nr:hypothetical protein H0E87_003477 [Populus deltoides]
MTVFGNLKFLEIKLCSFPSSSSLHVSRLNFMIGDGDSIQCELIFAVKTAVLSSTRRSRDVPLKSDMKFDPSFVETTMFLLKKMVPHWPKTLKKVVFLSANMQGSGSRGSDLRNDEHSMLRENVWILYGLAFPWEKGRLTTTDIVVRESVVKE